MGGVDVVAGLAKLWNTGHRRRRVNAGMRWMHCNICGGTQFTDMPKRPAVRCATCGSLERTRVAALYLTGPDRPPPAAAILHFAPERGLSGFLRGIGQDNYRAADIDPKRYPGLGAEPFDLCRDVFALPERHYDVIVHNHVLEHLECNYSAVLLRLVRALKPDGLMFFSVPILPAGFSDTVVDEPLDAKLARFGESLHMRVFGSEVLQQTLGMLFTIPERYDLTARFSESQLADANIPPHHWHAFTGASVFRVGPDDLRV